MKFKATISVEFDAQDIHDERRHRVRLEEALAQLSETYGGSSLEVRTRRPRTRPRAAPPARLEGEVRILRALYVD